MRGPLLVLFKSRMGDAGAYGFSGRKHYSRDGPYDARDTCRLLGNKLAGVVSIGDVVNYRLQELELETNVRRDA